MSISREEEVAAYVMLRAKEKYARHPKKLEKITPERCLRVARLALAINQRNDVTAAEEFITAKAVEEENKVCGGIFLTIAIQIIIRILAHFAIEYLTRKRETT